MGVKGTVVIRHLCARGRECASSVLRHGALDGAAAIVPPQEIGRLILSSTRFMIRAIG